MRRSSPGVAVSLALASALIVLSSACRRGDPQTPAEKDARGRELLQQTSATLKAAPTLAFDTVERHERVRRNGEKRTYSFTRQVRLRRPDRLSFKANGEVVEDLQAFYDGRSFTLVGNSQKVYAQVDAPNSVDALLDRLGKRLDVPMPMADFLYSDPSQSFQGAEFKGGWVQRTTIDGAPCHEVHYAETAVVFTLWVADDARALPCKAEIVYTGRPGQPKSDLTFRNWRLGETIADGEFTAKIPAGYERIPIIERIPKSELKADAAKAMGAAKK